MRDLAAENPHSLLRIPALLSGPDGLVARCSIETWKEPSSTGRTYTRCRITDDPPALPDGEYLVEFAGHTVRTHKYHGKWELTFLSPDLEFSPAA